LPDRSIFHLLYAVENNLDCQKLAAIASKISISGVFEKSVGVAGMVREIAVVAGLLASLPAAADEMTVSEARHFVTGKLFSYTCFDGTRGKSRFHTDGSVVGSIQFQGGGPVRYAALPSGTLRVEGERVCASLRGLPIQPCFYLERTNADSFRGSILGLSIAYCDFTRYQERAHVAHSKRPVRLQPSPTADKTELAPTP
jgi:hypothetical protein